MNILISYNGFMLLEISTIILKNYIDLVLRLHFKLSAEIF